MEIKKGYDDDVEPISEIYDVDGKRRGLGTLIYPVRKGWIIVVFCNGILTPVAIQF